jgi:hypothetical protein
MNAKEKKQLIKRIGKIQKLLNQFNVEACSYDPGVRCYRKASGYMGEIYMDFGHNEWEWLEPLLRELLYLRRKNVRKK